MVFSYYLIKFPYELIYKGLSVLKLNNYFAAYIGDELDWWILEPVISHLPQLKIVTKNKDLKKKLSNMRIKAQLLPCFARGIVMCRLAAHKFPAVKQIKIGMRHGPYHFKALSCKKNYLLFDHFIFTSEQEAEIAARQGITNGIALGYPRLDAAFNGKISSQTLADLSSMLGLNKNKKTLLFTATWEGSGLSAIDKWYDKLTELTNKYNILVSLHPWLGNKYRNKINNTSSVHLIKDYNTIPYIMLADICIGDTSSILAECCALDKPIITFKVTEAKRIVPEVMTLIAEFSIRIENFPQLASALQKYDDNPTLKSAERKKARSLFFSNLDGTSASKIADFIKKEFNL
jgi:hypothetical protein